MLSIPVKTKHRQRVVRITQHVDYACEWRVRVGAHYKWTIQKPLFLPFLSPLSSLVPFFAGRRTLKDEHTCSPNHKQPPDTFATYLFCNRNSLIVVPIMSTVRAVPQLRAMPKCTVFDCPVDTNNPSKACSKHSRPLPSIPTTTYITADDGAAPPPPLPPPRTSAAGHWTSTPVTKRPATPEFEPSVEAEANELCKIICDFGGGMMYVYLDIC